MWVSRLVTSSWSIIQRNLFLRMTGYLKDTKILLQQPRQFLDQYASKYNPRLSIILSTLFESAITNLIPDPDSAEISSLIL